MDKKEKEKQKSISRVWGVWNIVEALLLVCSGVLSIVIGSISETPGEQGPIQTVLAVVVGIFIALDGLLRIIMVLSRQAKTEQSIMLIGGFEITAGIVVAIMHPYFVGIIVNFLGVLLLVIGLLFGLFSIFSIAKRWERFYMPILEIVFGAILLSVGVSILILYYGSDTAMQNRVTLIVIGAVMGIAGLSQFIITLISLSKAKKQNYVVPIEDVDVFEFDKAEEKGKKKAIKKDIIEIPAEPVDAIEHKDGPSEKED